MRGVFAVAAGVAVLLLIRFVPESGVATGVVCTIALAIVSGFAAALIATRHHFRYAGMVGCAMVAMAVFSMWSRRAAQPAWNEIALGGCGPMAAMLGTGLRLLVKPG